MKINKYRIIRNFRVFIGAILTTFVAQNVIADSVGDERITKPSYFAPLPSLGDQRILVIPVGFSDVTHVIPPSSFYQQFFGTWPTITFKDYFKEASYNKLNYIGDVVGLDNSGTVALNTNATKAIRLSQTKSYYVADSRGVGGTYPRTITGVFKDAIVTLSATGFDFAPYADPITKEVNNVVIIFQGPTTSETESNPQNFQATAIELNHFGEGAKYTNPQGFVFNNFTFCPELDGRTGQHEGIGVCLHEHGHALGMQDLYDLSNQTAGGVGYYDLMGNGVYTNDANTIPPHPSVYSKIYYQWATPTVLNMLETKYKKPKKFKLKPAAKNPSFLKLDVGAGDEYFLVENRQAVLSDSSLNTRCTASKCDCSGIYIWHIDEKIIRDEYYNNHINSIGLGTPVHPGIALIEADGKKDLMLRTVSWENNCTDKWKVGKTWSKKGAANSSLWNGTATGVKLKVLSQDKRGTVTVEVSKSK